MKKILLPLLIIFLLAGCSQAPAEPPRGTQAWTPPEVPAVASYTMQARLDVAARQVLGTARVRYVNTTNTPIPDLVFHLYMNAFSGPETLFMQESGGQHRGFSADEPGWITVESLALADGAPLTLELLEDGTLARAALPQPVPPGEALELEVAFTTQLPPVFARTGYALDAAGDPFFMVGQWFPKLGVWQGQAGWNAYPFHANNEFFADFGAYDVSLTVPDGYLTGATGLPVGEHENGDGTTTIQYQAEAVIDFAWTASPNFQMATRMVDGAEVVYIYLPEHAWTAERALDASEAALRGFGEWYGAYPYRRLTVLDVPDQGAGAGGMEYPMLITAGELDVTGITSMGPLRDALHFLEMVIVHEAGHQWWQSTVAFNEVEEPWLDEGFTDYSAVRLMGELYGMHQSVFESDLVSQGYLDLRRSEYTMDPWTPMYGRAYELENYGTATYAKPALSLLTLERVLGEETMLEVMSTFYQRYQFGHPTTEDFRAVAQQVSGQELDWFFDGLVYGDAAVNYAVTEVNEHRVVAVRQGELRLPTEVQVTFADGISETVAWDGQPAELVLAYPQRVVTMAQVDPGDKLLVDLVWSDNGLTRRAQLGPWLALVSRVVYLLQNGLLGLGGL